MSTTGGDGDGGGDGFLPIDLVPQGQNVYYIILSGSAASVAGSLFVALSFLLLPHLRRHPFQLVFMVSVVSGFYSLKFLVAALLNHNGSFDANTGNFHRQKRYSLPNSTNLL